MLKYVFITLNTGSLDSLITAKDTMCSTNQMLSTIHQQVATRDLYWHQIWICPIHSRQVKPTLTMNHRCSKVNYVVLFSLVFCASRLVKMVTGKLVNWFTTCNRFSERITGCRVYRTSCRHDPGNADRGVLPLSGCTRVSAYPHCAAVECRCPLFSHNSSIAGSFWTSVLTGRLLTSAVHVYCLNIWTVLYFWMK